MSRDATDEQTRKDRATQPLDAGRLSFAKIGTRFHVPIHLPLEHSGQCVFEKVHREEPFKLMNP